MYRKQKNILWCTERQKMCDWKGIHHKGIHHIMALLWWWSHGWAPQKSHYVHWFQPTFFKASILQRILEVNNFFFLKALWCLVSPGKKYLEIIPCTAATQMEWISLFLILEVSMCGWQDLNVKEQALCILTKTSVYIQVLKNLRASSLHFDQTLQFTK